MNGLHARDEQGVRVECDCLFDRALEIDRAIREQWRFDFGRARETQICHRDFIFRAPGNDAEIITQRLLRGRGNVDDKFARRANQSVLVPIRAHRNREARWFGGDGRDAIASKDVGFFAAGRNQHNRDRIQRGVGFEDSFCHYINLANLN